MPSDSASARCSWPTRQAAKTFRELWPLTAAGRYAESMMQGNAFVVCGSIQSVALNLERFKPDDFGYIIVDEAHHASADTYQKVLSYFTPEFTLGLAATTQTAGGGTSWPYETEP